MIQALAAGPEDSVSKPGERVGEVKHFTPWLLSRSHSESQYDGRLRVDLRATKERNGKKEIADHRSVSRAEAHVLVNGWIGQQVERFDRDLWQLLCHEEQRSTVSGQ